MKKIFQLDAPAVLPELEPSGDGFVVVAVTQRKKASDAEFAADKEKLQHEAMQGKQYELRDSYLKALKKSAQVVTNTEALDRAAEG